MRGAAAATSAAGTTAAAIHTASLGGLLPSDAPELTVQEHVRYLHAVLLRGLPPSHEKLDPNRLTLVHFAVAGLDVLGELRVLEPEQRRAIVEWVRRLQIRPPAPAAATAPADEQGIDSGVALGGFRGGPFHYFGAADDRGEGAVGGGVGGTGDGEGGAALPNDHTHIAMGYSALAVLRTLLAFEVEEQSEAAVASTAIGGGVSSAAIADGPADARRRAEQTAGDSVHSRLRACVNVRGILDGIRLLQREDGCFEAYRGGEHDMRFVYCAAVTVWLLPLTPAERAAALRQRQQPPLLPRRAAAGEPEKGESGTDGSTASCPPAIDVAALVRFVQRSQNYDGGIGLCPGAESHGGSTYCAVAALWLLGLPLLRRPGAPGARAAGGDVHGGGGGVLHPRIVQWCTQRYRKGEGLQGRVSKPCDSCYGWWVGAALALLLADGEQRHGEGTATEDVASTPAPAPVEVESTDTANPVDDSESAQLLAKAVRVADTVEFVLECQKPRSGGFGKYAGKPAPEPYAPRPEPPRHARALSVRLESRQPA